MGKAVITVTVDWDGADNKKISIFNRGIGAILSFNNEFKTIPLTHYICPVFFTRNKELSNYYQQVIRQVVKGSACEVGLHVHCWKSLMKYCGLFTDESDFMNIPTFYSNPAIDPFVEYEDDLSVPMEDKGHGIPLGAYEKKDIEVIINKSRQLLLEYQIADENDLVGFRCGGVWLLTMFFWRCIRRVLNMTHQLQIQDTALLKKQGSFYMSMEA
ncbi:MAG: hypothetical protein GY749_44560 [Desulfobacteraceae bacterium]|nr:hypothetical protein [Desulfobacteraceae bacterium]